MTRAEIAAELRRSACEDVSPWQCDPHAFHFVVKNYVEYGEWLFDARHDAIRMLYLIVAEALT